MARRDAPLSDLDRLFQVPLSDFISERNLLAKRAGADAAIRGLSKPTLPAWAVNQLYWQRRAVYDELVARAADLRATHNAAMRGRPADLRGASRAHEEAVEAALKETMRLLNDSGHPATDATRQAVATTLRALPGDEAPGRLTRPLQPRGFETLGAAAAAGQVRPPDQAAPRKPAAGESRETREQARAAAARDKQEAARAAKLREAEALARREEFEAARAAREVERARRRLAEAERALAEAQAEADEARQAEAAAVNAHEAARARAAKAAKTLEGLKGG